MPSRSRLLEAFTRTELVAVVAGIALLVALGFPAVASTRSRSRQEVCADNLQALMRATKLYADDHRDEFPMVTHGGDAQAGPIIDYANRSSFRPWATGWLDWTTSRHNTNTAFLVDPRHAVLGGYTREARLYRCPADVFLHPTQRTRGWSERVRSYSANLAVGRGNKSPSDGLLSAEKLFIKFSDIDRPSPSQLFVFIEENPDSINDPAFSNSQTDRRWIDLPGAYHPTTETNRASNLAFADGHVENHAWSATVLGDRANFIFNPPAVRSGDPDRAWLLDRTSYHRNAVR